jgi:hypothetical protein
MFWSVKPDEKLCAMFTVPLVADRPALLRVIVNDPVCPFTKAPVGVVEIRKTGSPAP